MRYYSAKADHLVARYGTGSHIGAVIGVVQDGPDKGETKVEYDTQTIVAIPDKEFAAYAREYLTHERDGSLTVRTEVEYNAQKKAVADAEKAQAEAAEKEAKEREAEAKKAEAAAIKDAASKKV
jgi:hypothetical protein